MNIIFETNKGRGFMIEEGSLDTIAEVKEKIKKYQRIPVDHQTLFYQNELLYDDWDIEQSLLFHGSRAHLIIADPSRQFKPPPPVRNGIQIILRAETGEGFSLEIGVDDTVESLKHIIAQITGGLTIDRIALRTEFGNVEMKDSNRMRDYNLMDGSKLILCQKTPSGTELMKEMSKALDMADETESFQSNGVQEGDTIEIFTGRVESQTASSSSNCSMKVQVMHLEDKKKDGEVKLPEGYFFPHKKNVMEENESIEGLGVREDDSIKILAGKAPSATSSSMTPSSSSSSSSSKMMIIFIEYSNGNILVFDTNSTMKVQETRIHIKKAKKDKGFELPEPCFFIHNGSRMEDKQSLEWHKVREGDTIYISSSSSSSC